VSEEIIGDNHVAGIDVGSPHAVALESGRDQFAGVCQILLPEAVAQNPAGSQI
jgi:hypothetical protein